MPSSSLPCIVCSKTLSNVFEDVENQPNDGLTFMSHGQYGSTEFDPMDGTYIEINVCDECLVAAREKGNVLHGRNRRLVLSEGCVVGFEHVDRGLFPWTGEENFDDDVLHVEPDEIWADEITWTHEGRQRIEWRVPRPNKGIER
jgi:hypothetical protein